MDLNLFCQIPEKSGINWRLLIKMLMTMKLAIMLSVICIQVYAGVSAQNVSLSTEKASLKEIFKQINRQTGHEFLYNSQMLEEALPVSVELKNVSLTEALESCFKDQPFTYTFVGETIVVTPKAEDNLNEAEASITITGKVTDKEGKPLPGATILIKGTFKGITTNVDGEYSITVPDSKTVLIFSYVGFAKKEIKVGNKTFINVSLEQAATELKEVTINAGYYKMKKKTATSNIAQLKAEAIEQQPVSNPLLAMKGRMTGVDIIGGSGLIGGNYTVQIRGLNSLRNDGNNPLYLIDGIPYPAESRTFSRGFTHPLNFINPNDIESIEVLKDADATAIYGSRGANGVILITTKKAKAGNTQVSVNAYTGISRVSKTLDVLNLEQYLAMREEAFANDGAEPRSSDYDVNGTWDQTRETDWQDELLRGKSAKMDNVQATVSGGTEKTRFLISTNYLKQTTLYSHDFYDQKFSTNFKINHRSEDGKLNIHLSGLYTLNDLNLSNFSSASINSATRFAPNAPPLYDEEGNINWEEGTWSNPIVGIHITTDNKTHNWVANLGVGYTLFKGLTLKTKIGFSEIRTDRITKTPSKVINPYGNYFTKPLPNAFLDDGVSKTWNIEPQAEYITQLRKGVFTAFVGFTFQETSSNRQGFWAKDYTSDALLGNPEAAGVIEARSYDSRAYRFSSIFGRLNYNLEDTYIVNITGRRDGSSRFGPGKKFANFAAIGAAWIFSNEDFIKDNFSFINYGKLRMSYGTTGSDNIGDYQYLAQWKPVRYPYDDILGLLPNNLFNEDFAWEKTTKLEIGLELGLFKNRVNPSISYYHNESSNQLVGKPLPHITGFQNIQSNFPALVRNTGLEIELYTINIKNKDFRWSTNFNITMPDNKLVSFENFENSSYANRYIIGKSIYIRKYYVFKEVDPETGIAILEDVDGDGRMTYAGDRTAVFDLQKQFYGGLTNTISYKGLSLDFTFRFVKQLGHNYLQYLRPPGYFANQPAFVLENRWQKPGDITDVPRLTQGGVAYSAYNNYYRYSDRSITDASFIRLQNVSLAYQFPSSFLEKLRLKSLKLYIQAQNLFVISNYKGWDPETAFSLPPLQTITFGLNITL